jgi:hypothetical protein
VTAPASLDLRLRHLLTQQNQDGGWGHYPGQSSWLEPTIYGVFALWEQHRKEAERGLETVMRWQHPEGGFRTSAGMDEVGWGTALVAMAQQSAGRRDAGYQRAVEWLIRTEGAEGGVVSSILKRFIKMPAEQNEELHGWPWRPGSSSWVEPTSFALLALKRHGGHPRVRVAEEMILDRRCQDGGWNYGNRRVYEVVLPSYPETTAVALLGLQGRKEAVVSLGKARQFWQAGTHGIGRAWLAIALEAHGALEAGSWKMEEQLPLGGSLSLTALEAVALQPLAVQKHFRTGAKG